ncbi:MAG: DUF1292 domain-containing protein [Clostridia bacterium]|nr:DUF1292 domain-containing protein [Clostridia bacterium]
MNDELKFEGSEEETYEPIIVSVVDEEGEEHIFEELDIIELDNKEYVALLPIYDDEVVDENGELIILMRNYNGDEIFLEPIEDEDEFMKIGKMFEERLADIFDFDDEE